MGIRFLCPNGHKLNVKSFLAGKRAICPQCGAKVLVPNQAEPTTEPSGTAGGTVTNSLAAAGQLANQPLTDTASPSVIIAVAEGEVVAPSGLESRSEVAPPPQAAAISMPDSIVVATSQPAIPANAVAMPPDAAYNLRRQRNRRNQIRIAVALFVMVIVLAMVLAWVLRRNANAPPASPPESTRVSDWAPLVSITIASSVLARGKNSRE